MNRKFIFLLVVILLNLFPCVAHARKILTEPELKASFIYNYTKFVEWPLSVRRKNDPVLICVMGNDPVIPYLREQNTSISKTKVIVKMKTDNLSDCHILYISSFYQGDIKKIINRTHTLPILTVSDMKGFSKLGGITSFFIKNNKVELEVNLTSMKSSQIVIDSELLEMMEINY